MAGSDGAREDEGACAVLVVEDDVDIRDSLVEALEGEGYAVHQAANGAQALGVLGRVQAPAVILLDLMMPIMDGWQFLAARRSEPALAGIPVIVVSAVARGSLGDDVAEVFQKPVDLERLLASVKRCCPQAAAG